MRPKNGNPNSSRVEGTRGRFRFASLRLHLPLVPSCYVLPHSTPPSSVSRSVEWDPPASQAPPRTNVTPSLRSVEVSFLDLSFDSVQSLWGGGDLPPPLRCQQVGRLRGPPTHCHSHVLALRARSEVRTSLLWPSASRPTALPEAGMGSSLNVLPRLRHLVPRCLRSEGRSGPSQFVR